MGNTTIKIQGSKETSFQNASFHSAALREEGSRPVGDSRQLERGRQASPGEHHREGLGREGLPGQHCWEDAKGTR